MPSAGIYTGPTPIEEFARFFSSTNPAVEGVSSSSESIFKGVTDDGICQVLLLSNSIYKFAPKVARATTYNITSMSMINYDPRENYIASYVFHLPELLMDDLFGITMATDRTLKYVCDIAKSCTETWAFNERVISYALTQLTAKDISSAAKLGGDNETAACMRLLQSQPIVTDGHRIDGNSQSCRALHSQLATRQTKHCAHISFLPQEDSGGAIKCQHSSLTEYATYFDEWAFEKYNTFMDANSWRVDVPQGYRITSLESMGLRGRL